MAEEVKGTNAGKTENQPDMKKADESQVPATAAEKIEDMKQPEPSIADKGEPKQDPPGLSSVVIDLSAARAGKDKQPQTKVAEASGPAAPDKKPADKAKTAPKTEEKPKAQDKSPKGAPSKSAAHEDKLSQRKAASGKGTAVKGTPKKGAAHEDKTSPTIIVPGRGLAENGTPAPSTPPQEPLDASRGEKEEIVYLDLTELHPFKNHPFGVRDDAEMRGLVDSVKAAGVNQPALVRPREDGGYEIVAGHRRMRASELAGYKNMPCIVRKMTDDEAILAMTDDNLRHRTTILPMEKAQSLKMQVEAIKHQGYRLEGVASGDIGKRSTEIVGERNGINYKQVQRYIRLTELVSDLQKMVDEKRVGFTPAVELSYIKPANQRLIAVSIEGEQASPSLSQAQKLRELDKAGKLNGDVIDGILGEVKKEVDKVIISTAELNKYFGKEVTPREMKDQILKLLDDWKAKQPPELSKPVKKTEKSL